MTGRDVPMIRAAIARMIAEQDATLAAMRADKPAVVDSHSDGKRVRYARTETRRDTLAAILAMLDGRDA